MEIPAENIIKHLKQTIADQAQQIAVQAAYIETLQQQAPLAAVTPTE